MGFQILESTKSDFLLKSPIVQHLLTQPSQIFQLQFCIFSKILQNKQIFQVSSPSFLDINSPYLHQVQLERSSFFKKYHLNILDQYISMITVLKYQTYKTTFDGILQSHPLLPSPSPTKIYSSNATNFYFKLFYFWYVFSCAKISCLYYFFSV